MIVVRLLAFVTAMLTTAAALAMSVVGKPEPTSADRFLDTYVEQSGRVVRHDQGGDTVSEGQSYAMLIAAESGDRATFERVWSWTRENLQRDDGLLAWHWKSGRVVDDEPASDADLDAVHALLVAARRFGSGRYEDDAARIAAAIRASETVSVGGRLFLLPGPWARSGPPHRYNPSYVSPRAFVLLGWDDVEVPRFEAAPPDWADVHNDGRLVPRARYGYEAARLPVRLAASPRARHREMAAAMWPSLRDHPFTDDHPVAMIGAAAAAKASGDTTASSRLVEQAKRRDASHPSYYGAAWIALAEVWLDLG